MSYCYRGNSENRTIVLVFLAFLGFGLLSWVASSYFEASAYNRLTDGNATVFDAMFTELRVVGSEE